MPSVRQISEGGIIASLLLPYKGKTQQQDIVCDMGYMLHKSKIK